MRVCKHNVSLNWFYCRILVAFRSAKVARTPHPANAIRYFRGEVEKKSKSRFFDLGLVFGMR